VDVIGEVVHGAAGSEPDAVDDTVALERLERAVDRREMHVGVLGLDHRRDVVGRDVMVRCSEQGVDDGPAADRDPPAVGAQDVEDRVDARLGGTVSVRLPMVRGTHCCHLRETAGRTGPILATVDAVQDPRAIVMMRPHPGPMSPVL
jgi:hypothetical protein